jgi:hypothetical protein
VTSQPDHSLADEPMVDETLPDESTVTASVTPDPLPGDPLPAAAASIPRPNSDVGNPGATGSDQVGDDLSQPIVISDDTELADNELGMRTTAASVAPGRLGGQWHDIQAMFVDDPEGSVQRAAQVTEAAATALAESLRRRQAALIPADDANNTEELREALRDYRDFYERLAAFTDQVEMA